VPAVSNVPNGKGSFSTVMFRPLLFCPVSFPDSVAVPPNLISAVFGPIWRFFGCWADSTAGIASMATTAIVMIVRFMSIPICFR
jgi:hypothetical protein